MALLFGKKGDEKSHLDSGPIAKVPTDAVVYRLDRISEDIRAMQAMMRSAGRLACLGAIILGLLLVFLTMEVGRLGTTIESSFGRLESRMEQMEDRLTSGQERLEEKLDALPGQLREIAEEIRKEAATRQRDGQASAVVSGTGRDAVTVPAAVKEAEPASGMEEEAASAAEVSESPSEVDAGTEVEEQPEASIGQESPD